MFSICYFFQIKYLQFHLAYMIAPSYNHDGGANGR